MVNTVTQNDFGIPINVSLVDKDNLPVSLLNATVTGTMVRPDKTKKEITFTITDSLNGLASYTLLAEDTEQLKLYKIYVSKNITGTSKVTASTLVMYNVVAEDGGAK